MYEAQRLQYLSVLGIDQYVARRQLAGAAPSQPLTTEVLIPEIPVGDISPQPVATPKNHTDVIETIAVVDQTIEKVSESLTKSEIKPPVVEDQPPVSSKVIEAHTSASKDIRFTLSVWRVADMLILDSRQPGTALPTDRLLQNILRAIGHPLAQLPASETIRWPLFNNNRMMVNTQQDADQARAMVQAYINAHHAKQPLSAIILMGQAAARFALNDADDVTECMGKVVSDSPWSSSVCITPSLNDMLQEPLQKAVAWQALKQLLQ